MNESVESDALAMADMHRPGRIGGHVFDIHRRAVTDVAPAVIAAEPHRGLQRIEPGRRPQREIDEAGACNFDLGDERITAQLFSNQFGEVAWFAAGILCQHHGRIGRHVAMAGIAWRLDRYARLIDTLGQHTRNDQSFVRSADALQHFGKNIA